jgi:hypothetical protein
MIADGLAVDDRSKRAAEVASQSAFVASVPEFPRERAPKGFRDGTAQGSSLVKVDRRKQLSAIFDATFDIG